MKNRLKYISCLKYQYRCDRGLYRKEINIQIVTWNFNNTGHYFFSYILSLYWLLRLLFSRGVLVNFFLCDI